GGDGPRPALCGHARRTLRARRHAALNRGGGSGETASCFASAFPFMVRRRQLPVELTYRDVGQRSELAEVLGADRREMLGQLGRLRLALDPLAELAADGLHIAVGRLRPAREELAHRRDRGELNPSDLQHDVAWRL